MNDCVFLSSVFKYCWRMSADVMWQMRFTVDVLSDYSVKIIKFMTTTCLFRNCVVSLRHESSLYWIPSFISDMVWTYIHVLKVFLSNIHRQNIPLQNIYHNIKTYDLFTLFTTIPHAKLKSRIPNIIKQCFVKKFANRKYNYMVFRWVIFYKTPLWFQQ